MEAKFKAGAYMTSRERNAVSPYLKTGRLADLLAAIQTMAIHDRYRRSVPDWADLICGDKDAASHWTTIFDDHPEFFRPSSGNPGEYALIWRRAGNNRYHRKLGRILERAEIDELIPEQRERYISRPPVPEAQVKTLLDTAISLHQKAVDAYRDRRWWVTPLTTVLSTAGSFLGAILGVHVKG
jgi:hypothetical protein